MVTEIQIVRATDNSFTTTFTDSNGAAIDLTGATVFFTVKSDLADTDDEALISKDVTSHTDPTNGITVITLTDTDTDIAACNYFYDIKLKDSGGNISQVAAEDFKVLDRVTRRTS